ncbi:SPOR domain-containing protein [Accumulibacter sp.]|uniref:SPOR domain-containing protein n=1 Tax=Accumulibacter sp. TaxID=2053492 RepID=UPI0025CD5EB1|nr:SPOR domain-containing protein [Accumulibacter sp.]MCM8613784.1 SPOR domain-containing protein [Accumulibacter sp.]MCM8637450.1 SPOR domain-containing protein [Accumulibacter sp.]MCM8641499.1 SPOR domain-containing protein [Accumulibacter sp.]
MRQRTNPVGGAAKATAQLGRPVAADGRKAALESQLRRRIGLAGLLIVLLSAALPLLDDLTPAEEAASFSPSYTEPVPVRKKEQAPLPTVQPAAETPVVVPLFAEPQASGAAIEASLAAAEAAVSSGGALAGETPAAAAAATSHPSSGLRLQTSFLPDRRRAEELQDSLAQAGIPASVETRLHVGPFRTLSEAEAARREIQKRGIDAIIVPGQGGQP